MDLADHNTLCTIDNKGATVSHQRNVTEENLFLPHFSIGELKADRDFDGHTIGPTFFLALRFGELDIIKINRIPLVCETHLTIGAVNGECRLEHFLKPVRRIWTQTLPTAFQLQKSLIGIKLDPDKVGQFTDFM